MTTLPNDAIAAMPSSPPMTLTPKSVANITTNGKM